MFVEIHISKIIHISFGNSQKIWRPKFGKNEPNDNGFSLEGEFCDVILCIVLAGKGRLSRCNLALNDVTNKDYVHRLQVNTYLQEINSSIAANELCNRCLDSHYLRNEKLSTFVMINARSKYETLPSASIHAPLARLRWRAAAHVAPSALRKLGHVPRGGDDGATHESRGKGTPVVTGAFDAATPGKTWVRNWTNYLTNAICYIQINLNAKILRWPIPIDV